MKKINRIFLFGDSFVEGQGVYEWVDNMGNFIEPNLPINDISEWRKENSWNKFIKEKTNCEVINNAKQGSDNYSQFVDLNKLITKLKPTDLVLFGFTSKLRDSGFSINYAFTQDYHGDPLLHQHNPLRNQIAWEKSLLYLDKYCTDLDGHSHYIDEFEKEFTKEYVEQFFSSVLDEQVFETIAQSNYLFYQNWIKKKGLNVIFFDIFEKYIDEKFVKPSFNVDTEIYISYKSKSLTDVLYEYEDKHIKETDKVSLWEWGQYKPKQTIHANQHGYKVFIDYLFDNFINKKYEF